MLTTSLALICLANEDCDIWEHPPWMRTSTLKDNATKYYEYLQDMEHHIDNSKVLKDIIRVLQTTIFENTSLITSKIDKALLTQGVPPKACQQKWLL